MLKRLYPHSRSATCLESLDPSQHLALFWGLRMLERTLPWPRAAFRGDFSSDVMIAAGWEEELDPAEPMTLCRVEERLDELEAEDWAPTGTVLENLTALADAVGLNEVERACFAVLVFKGLYDWFDELIEGVIAAGKAQGPARVVSLCTRLRESDCEQALASDGRLVASGLAASKDVIGRTSGVGVRVELLSSLSLKCEDSLDLLRAYVRPAPSSVLGEADFQHLATDREVLRRTLVANRGRKGVNILLWGIPGVGKTELARWLVEAGGFEGFEVSVDPGNSEQSARLGAYRLGQTLLAGREDTVMIFDEVEDVFGADSMFGMFQGPSRQKGQTNQLLESNPVPAIWISNSADGIDPAHLRRFQLVIEVRPPGRQRKLAMARKAFAGLPVDSDLMEELAEIGAVSPAQLRQAAEVLRRLRPENREAARVQLERIVAGHLEVIGCRAPKLGRRRRQTFDDALLNVQPRAALDRILADPMPGRYCFYGPPGTGKTAVARVIAERADRPLIVKRASDLLSMWVGGTEKAIAGMFREAEEEDAVLVLDEADSFLRDRKSVHQQWEATQVNELLTQMEEFEGWFFATTNLMDTVDQAALRRFDMKVYFDFMTPDAVIRHLRRLVRRPGHLPASLVNRLHALRALTPGDFEAVVRQRARSGVAADDADWFVEALEAELVLKPGVCQPQRGVGFLAEVG